IRRCRVCSDRDKATSATGFPDRTRGMIAPRTESTMRSKVTRKNAPAPADRPMVSDTMQRHLKDVALLLLLPVVLYLLICLLSYNPADPAWSRVGDDAPVHNIGGVAGAYLADLCFYFFGYVAYALPLLMLWLGWNMVRGRPDESRFDPSLRLLGTLLFLLFGCALAHLHLADAPSLPESPGGLIGQLVGGSLASVFAHVGATLLVLAVFLAALTLAFGISWPRVMDRLGEGALWLASWIGERFRQREDRSAARAPR